MCKAKFIIIFPISLNSKKYLARKNQNRVADLALAFFVGRMIDDFAVHKHRGRAAAVQIHRVSRALFEQKIRQLIKTHSAACLASAVNRHH